MNGLRREIADFLNAKKSKALEARRMAALQIACHVDLAGALDADPATRTRVVLRLERMIERERQRGIRKHWSYDLNRHIALKQALDRLRPVDLNGVSAKAQRENGATRRRSTPELSRRRWKGASAP